MSVLPVMEKLLEGVEVEWKLLCELGEFVRGSGLQKKDFTETGTPAIHYGQIYTFYGDETNVTKSFVSDELALTLKKVNTGDVVITNTSENLEDVGKALLYSGTIQAVTGGHATIFKPSEKILGKYFVYWTKTKYFFDEKRRYAKGTKVIDVSATDLSKFQIPIPPLDIQAEIVRILDAFTAYTAELTAELNARKKQYNHYRDQLLSFSDTEVEWKTLGEVGRIVTGRTPKTSEKSAWGDEVDFVTPSDIKNDIRTITCVGRRLSAAGAASMSNVLIPSGSLLVTCIGADMGKTVINANDCIPNQQINAIVPTYAGVKIGYLFHVLASKREALRQQGEKGSGTMPIINKSDFSKISIPIPALEEQARIVAILDKFDALTASLSEGLPREIQLRQQQYEYYRDRLLSFPRPAEAL